MNSTSNSNNDDITFDLPAREGTAGYVGMFFAVYMRTSALLTSTDVYNDTYRLQRTTQFMISLIAGKEKRDKIRAQLNENISTQISDAKEKNGGSIDKDINDHIVDQCTLEIIGDITDFIDEHVGVSLENKLGSV